MGPPCVICRSPSEDHLGAKAQSVGFLPPSAGVENQHSLVLLTDNPLHVEIDIQGSVGDSEGQPVATFREWQSEVGPVFLVLIDVLNACHRSCKAECSSSLGAHADQLRAASRDVEEWIRIHPCPHPDLNIQLGSVASTYGYVGRSLEVLAQPAPNVWWTVVERQLAGLHALIDETVRMMRGRSMRM